MSDDNEVTQEEKSEAPKKRKVRYKQMLGNEQSMKIVERKKKKVGRPKSADAIDWAPRFIRSICEGNALLVACEHAGVHPSAIYRRRKVDPQFALAFQEAREIGTEELEAEAARRAMHGTLKPVYYKGEEVGQVREYSDTLTIFLLKARKPEIYRDQQEQGRSTRVNVTVQANLEAVQALNQLLHDVGAQLNSPSAIDVTPSAEKSCDTRITNALPDLTLPND